MKPFAIFSSIFAVCVMVSAPTVGFAHVGHGDEFQAEGGIERVRVNPETDSLLGIVVTPIAPSTEGSPTVMVPVTALVDADGKQLVFVQYENFYEPVEVTTGATQGELIEVTEGLSIGEQLVTQGSLSLYAESRKTQNADSAAPSEPIATSPTEDTANSEAIAPSQTDDPHARAHATGTTHSHDASGNLALQSEATTQESAGFPLATVAALGGGAVLVVGGLAVMGNRKKGGL